MKRNFESKVLEFFDSLGIDIDFQYHINLDEIDYNNAFESIYDMLNDSNAFDCEVIYYGVAMEYLMNNDPSLQESLSLASELGYQCENVNSELLASLLKSEDIRNDFSNCENEINDFFEPYANIFQSRGNY